MKTKRKGRSYKKYLLKKFFQVLKHITAGEGGGGVGGERNPYSGQTVPLTQGKPEFLHSEEEKAESIQI